MATVPETLIRRLTLTWEDAKDGLFEDSTETVTALAVIDWLNDPENREEAQALLEPFETGTQVELLEDLSREAQKVVILHDDTPVIAHAIGVMQLLEDLVREARANVA